MNDVPVTMLPIALRAGVTTADASWYKSLTKRGSTPDSNAAYKHKTKNKYIIIQIYHYYHIIYHHYYINISLLYKYIMEIYFSLYTLFVDI